MRRALTTLLLIGPLAALLSACADGSGNSTSESNPLATAPRLGTGSVVVRVVDTAGDPVPGAWTSVEDRTGTVRAESVDADGYATFGDIWEGSAQLNANAWGYYDAGIRTSVADNGTTRELVTLERRNATTAAVLGTRAVSKSADGRTLVLETDIAVLDESGQPLLGLTDALFTMPGYDCGWGLCINGPDGSEIGSWLPVTGTPDAFGLVPASSRRAYAAGLLVDQGRIVAERQADPFRVNAIVEFLGNVTGTDSVALAEFSERSPESVLQTHGDFVSDGRLLLDAARGLGDRVGGSSPVVPAMQDMLGFMASQSPAAAPTLVLISDQWLEAPDRLVLAIASRTAHTPIVTIAGHEAAAELAVRAGGIFVNIDFPAQYHTALRGLDSMLSVDLPFYRMRFSITIDYAAALTPEATLFTAVRIQVSERDLLYVPVVLPL